MFFFLEHRTVMRAASREEDAPGLMERFCNLVQYLGKLTNQFSCPGTINR